MFWPWEKNKNNSSFDFKEGDALKNDGFIKKDLSFNPP